MSEGFDFLGSPPQQQQHGDQDPFAVDEHEEVTVLEGEAGDEVLQEEGDQVVVHEEVVDDTSHVPSTSSVPSSFLVQAQEEEISPLRQYQISHSAALAEKNAKSEEKHRQITGKAQADIDNFYKERALKRDKTELRNKENESTFVAARDATLANSTSWESVGNLVDLQSKPLGKDTARMRQVLVQLKH